jgi:hypothetical protein
MPGRPPIDPQTAPLILRMARENARWGCVRICGELRKLGIRVGATTIRALLRRHGLGPAPRRLGPTWAQFLRVQAEGIVACDFFTVETIRLKTLHVLFFIQLSTRRVVATEVTAHPDTAWVTQQGRNAAMELGDQGVSIRFLLRDHDAKFTPGFDEVFDSEEGKVVRTPIRAPKANAYAERWVQTVRAECLDWTLVLGRRHLLRLLQALLHLRGRRHRPVLKWRLISLRSARERLKGADRECHVKRSSLQVEDVEGADRQMQQCPASCGADLAAVPVRPGPGDPGLRLLPRRHGVVPAPVRGVRAGACHPPGAHPRRDRQPDRGVGGPAGPEPAHGPGRPHRAVQVPDS